jgi:hypothetical protein
MSITSFTLLGLHVVRSDLCQEAVLPVKKRYHGSEGASMRRQQFVVSRMPHPLIAPAVSPAMICRSAKR